jgi:hypothetical protein
VDLLKHHHSLQSNMASNLAEERGMADVYLRQGAARVPDSAPELTTAAKIYQEEHELARRLCEVAGDKDQPDAYQKLRDPGIRRELAGLIAGSAEKEIQAARWISSPGKMAGET